MRFNDVDRAVFLLVNAVPGVIRAAIQADPTARTTRVSPNELTDMIVRYLAARAVVREVPRSLTRRQLKLARA